MGLISGVKSLYCEILKVFGVTLEGYTSLKKNHFSVNGLRPQSRRIETVLLEGKNEVFASLS